VQRPASKKGTKLLQEDVLKASNVHVERLAANRQLEPSPTETRGQHGVGREHAIRSCPSYLPTYLTASSSSSAGAGAGAGAGLGYLAGICIGRARVILGHFVGRARVGPAIARANGRPAGIVVDDVDGGPVVRVVHGANGAGVAAAVVRRRPAAHTRAWGDGELITGRRRG
jgi:hypothetical protein